MPHRRALVAAGPVGLAAWLASSGRADADTRFVNFAFPATGAPTSRTMPDRLAEIHNVLDFGADPTGTNDCAAAIQAAVDVVAGAGRGTVYFPLGFYKTLSSVTYNYNGPLSIIFRGEGALSTTISGNFNDFIFKRSLGTPSNEAFVSFERMNLSNGNSGSASGCIRAGSCAQAAFRDLNLNGYTSLTTEDSAGISSQCIFLENVKFQASTQGVGRRGLIIGGSGAMEGCDFIGSDIAVVAYGNGLFMGGNRIENCNTAYQFGLDSAGVNAGMTGFTLTSGSTEGNIVCVDMAGTCVGGFLGPMGMLGHPAAGIGQSGSTPSQYGLIIRADCAQGCTFYGMSSQSYFTVAAISIANATSRANNVFVSTLATNPTGPGVIWELPTNAYTAQFIQCNTQPVWTFSQLPSGGNVLEGDEYSISDSNTATWGATAAGSGSNHVAVRWNGSNYTVFGS